MQRPSSLAWLVGALICLQVVAPFLHAHFGAWRVGGFHLDGAVALAERNAPIASADAAAFVSARADRAAESPAVGVSPASRDAGEYDGWVPVLVALLVVPWLLSWPPPRARMGGSRDAVPRVPRRRPPNAPPPSLAPPATA